MQRTSEGGYLFSPGDLINFLGCRHCTVLDLKNLTEPSEKDKTSPIDALLRDRGLAHDGQFLAALRERGMTIAEIPGDRVSDERLAITKEELSSGADVIYQAVLELGNWRGYADFLIKVDTPSALGEFSYEVLDTKLCARGGRQIPGAAWRLLGHAETCPGARA